MDLKISIVTATYNSAETLQDTLQSIIDQTYKNIEHIIIDGLSKDNTLEIIKQFPYVAKVISEKDKGIYDAMNKGIRVATGDIIGILNSDDIYFDKNVIQDVVNVFELNTNVNIVYSDLVFTKHTNLNIFIRKWRAGQFNRFKLLHAAWQPPHPTVFVRKSIYDKYGCFNLDFKIAADYEFLLRVLSKESIMPYYLERTTIKMRYGGESTKQFKNNIILISEYVKAFKVNDLKLPFYTIPIRILSKIPQFFQR
jgi:glycosyltransferase involved in cell wall biosynthesis